MKQMNGFPAKDAWEQLHDLQEEFIRDWFDFRDDLEVVADALDRCVRLNSVQHNVTTVREYIEILTEACDFVDSANPRWAKGHGPHTVISR